MTKKAQSTKPSKTSKQWLKRHFDDPYVKKAGRANIAQEHLLSY